MKPFNAAAAELFRKRPALRSFSWVDPGRPEADPADEVEHIRSLLANSSFADKPNCAVRIVVKRPNGRGPCPVSTEILR